MDFAGLGFCFGGWGYQNVEFNSLNVTSIMESAVVKSQDLLRSGNLLQYLYIFTDPHIYI